MYRSVTLRRRKNKDKIFSVTSLSLNQNHNELLLFRQNFILMLILLMCNDNKKKPQHVLRGLVSKTAKKN